MVKKTTKDFILAAKLIHGEKYDYSQVNYITNNISVKIICPIHGEFNKAPTKHINAKQGCPKCGLNIGVKKQTKSKTEFINEANKKHNNNYDYSLVNYINAKTKVQILCPVHGIFEQTPDGHLSGRGCRYCGGTSLMDTNLFIYKAKLVHNNKYDYSYVDYINNRTPVKIICPIHGEFKQLPNNHLSKKQGCYDCLNKIYNSKTFSDICSIIHNNKYDYSLVNYTKNTDNVTIICPIHGEFKQRCDSHRSGIGCSKCSNNGISKEETELKDFLNSLDIKIIENDRMILEGKELDIFIPSHNIAIEYNGLYWHSEQYIDKNYHLNKTEACEAKGIQLIHIFEDEWLYKQDIVKSRLKNILGLTQNKIWARKCEIKIVDTKDSK